jgi:hypothetical protein
MTIGESGGSCMTLGGGAGNGDGAVAPAASWGLVLEECNPVVLVLFLTLVLVGRLPPELVVVKINFTNFLTIYSSFTKQ